MFFLRLIPFLRFCGIGCCWVGMVLTLPGFVEAQKSPQWVWIEGVSNARDAGGYAACGGAKVRWGVLYRSNQLSYMTELGQEQFLALGIKTVVDFRMVVQVESVPEADIVLNSTSYHHFPIDIVGVTSEEIYWNIVNTFAPSLTQAFLLLADPNNLPFLCHCVVGKDRTGVFIALVHRLLGVSDEDVMADYLLSLAYGYVDPAWLDTVLTQVDLEGGIEIFLENRGVSREVQQAIRANLLEPASAISEWELYL